VILKRRFKHGIILLVAFPRKPWDGVQSETGMDVFIVR
jgi:hypothetical protein